MIIAIYAVRRDYCNGKEKLNLINELRTGLFLLNGQVSESKRDRAFLQLVNLCLIFADLFSIRRRNSTD